jgi:predicted glycosyltransferase involved in capsule biosynthesis
LQILSPAAPGIFAIQSEYLKKLGGFDWNLLQFGTETIELSLRIWLCGGVIIRQPCSRVAHSYPNLFNDVVNSGATVGAHDRNAMLISGVLFFF